MDEREEERMVRLVGQIDGDELTGRLDGCGGGDDGPVPEEAMKRIRQATYRKLGLRPSRQKRPSRVWTALAASLLLVFVTAAAVGPQKAWAIIRERLQFIPGLGIVLERSEATDERYVLTVPVEKEVTDGKIKIKGIVSDWERTVINITGAGLSEVREISIEDMAGRIYPIKTYSIGSTGDSSPEKADPVNTATIHWDGVYVYPGNISDPSRMVLVFNDKDNLRVAVELEKAVSYESYAAMGPTAAVGDVSVTAVTSREGGKMKINLLTPPLSGKRVTAYGSNLAGPPWESLVLTDADGKRYPLTGEGGYSPPLRELYLGESSSADREYTLTIPSIILVYEGKTRVTLDIPAEGSIDLNEVTELAGFPLRFYRAERLEGDEVRFYVDTEYRPERGENLISFELDGGKLPFRSYGMEFDPAMTSVQSIQFRVKPEMRKITLHLKNAEVLKQGPWVLPLGPLK